MYVGVGAAITGQALILGSLAVLVYDAAFFAMVSAFVIVYEEPVLAADSAIRTRPTARPSPGGCLG